MELLYAATVSREEVYLQLIKYHFAISFGICVLKSNFE